MSIESAIDALIEEVEKASVTELRDAMASINRRSVDDSYGDAAKRELCRDLAYTIRLHIRFKGKS